MHSVKQTTLVLALALFLAGCGGGGGLSDGGRSYQGFLHFFFGGEATGFDTGVAKVTVTKLELLDSNSEQYQTVWTGSKEVDVLSSRPQLFECVVQLGTEVTSSYEALRITISRVILVDEDLGSWDENVSWSLEFPLDMRLHAGRQVALKAVLPIAAIDSDGDNLTLNEEVVHQVNGTVDGVLEPRWVDAVYLDLSNLPFEIEMHNGLIATGMWFTAEKLGFFVDDPGGAGGRFFSWYDDEFAQIGTYRYDNAQKSSVTWYVEDSYYGVLTGKAYALSSVCPLKPNAWNALVMGGGNATHGVFILAKIDFARRIVDIYGGDVVLNDERDPTKGGTAQVSSLYRVVYGPELERFPVSLTYDGKVSGTYSFTGSHGPLPNSGTWQLYLPGG